MTAPEEGQPDRSRLVLASASERRRDLLAALGLVFEIRPADVDETPHPGESAADLVGRLSNAKALAVPMYGGEVIVAADTVVEVDAAILGKPADVEDARRMLHMLSGRSHRVVTGMAVKACPTGSDIPQVRSTVETTAVTFSRLGEDDVDWYLTVGAPFDKAGAYAVQGAAGLFVTRIEGSYDNVVGLPRAALSSLLAGLGFGLLDFSA